MDAKISEHQRSLVREKIASLTAHHHRNIASLTKDFEAERRRLERMLQTGICPQRIEQR